MKQVTDGVKKNKSVQQILKEYAPTIDISFNKLNNKWYGYSNYKPLRFIWENKHKKFYQNSKKQPKVIKPQINNYKEMFVNDVYKEISRQINAHSKAEKQNKVSTRRLKMDELVTKYKGSIVEEVVIGVINESFIKMKKQHCEKDVVTEIFEKRTKDYDLDLMKNFKKIIKF
jgi:hypothetical protein